MKKITLASILLFICFAITHNTTHAQAFAMGVVDVEAIVKEMPEAQTADKELIDLSKKFQDTIME